MSIYIALTSGLTLIICGLIALCVASGAISIYVGLVCVIGLCATIPARVYIERVERAYNLKSGS